MGLLHLSRAAGTALLRQGSFGFVFAMEEPPTLPDFDAGTRANGKCRPSRAHSLAVARKIEIFDTDDPPTVV